MVKQFATFLATMTLLVSTSGCSGMRNFLFGRGAACSTCATTAPTYGVVPRSEPTCGYEPTCGHEPTCGYEPGCGYEPSRFAPLAGLRSGCGLLHGRSVCNGSQACNCGQGRQSYMLSNVDSYNGNVHDPYAYGGEVIGSQVMGDSYNGYPTQGTIIQDGLSPGVSYPGGVVQDDFNARSGIIMNPVPGTVLQQ